MTGFVLGLIFAGGVGLVWHGVRTEHGRPKPVRLPFSALLIESGVPLSPLGLLVTMTAGGVTAGLLAWWALGVPILSLAAIAGGAWAPLAWLRARRSQRRRERERAWPAAVDQLADALEAGLALPAAVVLVGQSGPEALRADFTTFDARRRANGLAAAVDGLSTAPERAAETMALLLHAGMVELPAGGLAPAFRDLARVLFERFEAHEKARTRSSSLHLEAAVLAVSPIALMLIVGLASPTYLDAYRTPGGTLVAAVAGLLIVGCYVLMRKLGRVPDVARTRDRA